MARTKLGSIKLIPLGADRVGGALEVGSSFGGCCHSRGEKC